MSKLRQCKANDSALWMKDESRISNPRHYTPVSPIVMQIWENWIGIHYILRIWNTLPKSHRRRQIFARWMLHEGGRRSQGTISPRSGTIWMRRIAQHKYQTVEFVEFQYWKGAFLIYLISHKTDKHDIWVFALGVDFETRGSGENLLQIKNKIV